MRRVRVLFVLLAVGLLAPLAVLIHRAQQSATLERQVRHQAVAERVFDEMERGLSRVLEREEAQPADRYGRNPPAESWPFVAGYFEIDPHGAVRVLSDRQSAATVRAIEQAVSAPPPRAGPRDERAVDRPSDPRQSHDRFAAAPPPAGQVPGTTVAVGPARERALAAAEEAPNQAVAAFDALRSLNKGALERQRKLEQEPAAVDESLSGDYGWAGITDERSAMAGEPDRGATAEGNRGDASARSDVTPMIGRVVDDRHLMLTRTVVRDTRAYRQGVLLELASLSDWLRTQGLGSDGIADAASVAFVTPYSAIPAPRQTAAYVYEHRFAEPFADLRARLTLQQLPGADNVTYVYVLGTLLLATAALGLAALYRMVAVVVRFAERRSSFVAAVTHELKTPLTAIRMYGEMLRDGLVGSDAKRQEYYRHITVESERLSRLINNVLEYGRLEKGNRDVALVGGPIAPVVREVATLVQPHVERHGFTLAVEVDEAAPPVRFERDALMQVLWNLVDNAVKYARDAPVRSIVLRCWGDAGGVHVAVRDHGPGVAAGHLAHVFEPFYRGETELTRHNTGTGLGLALVQGLAERMGARVRAQNLAGGGFEVIVSFRSETSAPTGSVSV